MKYKFRWFINRMIIKFLPSSVVKKLAICKTVAYRLSVPDLQTFKEKITTFLHLLICPPCWFYKKQIDLISRGLKEDSWKLKREADMEKLERLEKKVVEQNKKK